MKKVCCCAAIVLVVVLSVIALATLDDFVVSPSSQKTSVTDNQIATSSITETSSQLSNEERPGDTGLIYINLTDDMLSTTSAYGNGKKIHVHFGKRGGNKLPDFIYFELSDGEDLAESSKKEIFLYPDTDWHGPFVVLAVNNQDGDMPSGYATHYTGGNHAYNNDSTGSATAKCDTLEYYVNGEKVTEYSGYANDVRIFWRNYIQGNNTKKADGTGRYILCEEHTLTFDGVEWNTEVEIIPLEDIVINTYYGFQLCGLSAKRYSNIQYENAENQDPYPVPGYSCSGNAYCDGMVAYGNSHKEICRIDTEYGLGTRSFYDGKESVFSPKWGKLLQSVFLTRSGKEGAFSEKWGKAYFSIIRGDHVFRAGERYKLRGVYQFTSYDN